MANVYNMSSHNGNQDKLNEANAIKSRMTVFSCYRIDNCCNWGRYVSFYNESRK